MVDQIITRQDLIDAHVDAQALEDIVNDGPEIQVQTRLGRLVWTLATLEQRSLLKIQEWQNAIDSIVIDSGVPDSVVINENGETQEKINNQGGATWYAKSGGYKLNDRVILENGDIVRSTVVNNTVDPNADMAGWLRNPIQTTYDAGYVGPSDTRLLSDKYASLALAQVDFPFVTDLDASLGWAVLQKQFNALSVSTSAKDIVNGTYYVNRTLNYSAKGYVDWNLRLVLDNGAIGQHAIIFDNIDNAVLKGKITLACKVSDAAGPHNWAIRSWWDGILFKRATGADWSGLYINSRLKGQLVKVDGENYNSNYMNLGFMTGTCGSLENDFIATITNKVNSGSENNTDQRTTLTLSAPISGDLSGYSVKIGAARHLIVSNSGNSIVVTPWVFDASSTTSIIYGGILKTVGDDANNLRAKKIRGFESSTTLICATQMGIVVDDFGAEHNEIAVQFGTKFNSDIKATQIEQWYSEFNAIDIFDARTTAQVYYPVKIKNEVGLTIVNWASNKIKLTPFSSAGVPYPNSSNLLIEIGSLGKTLSLQNRATGLNVNSTDYVYLGTTKKVTAFNDTHTFQIDCTAKALSLGYNTLEIFQSGQRGYGGVITTVLQCFSPQTIEGATENSGRTLRLSYTAKPRRLFLQLVGTVIKVRELNDVMFTPVAGLNTSYGNDRVKFDATTATKGTNASVAGVLLSHNTSIDYSTFSGVEESWYYNPSTMKIEHKIRSRQSATVSDWVDLVTEQMPAITNLDTTTATTSQIATKVNDLLSAMRLIKLLKT